MSDSSDEEFEGFSQNEVDTAAQWYNQRLQQIGIGELDAVESENEFSDENEPLVDEDGDRPAEADGWHDNFNYYETGLPHLFLPCRNTGPTTVLEPNKEPVDFFSLLFTNAILQYIIQETDRYANKQIREHPDENKSSWVTPTAEEMKAFLGLCFLMGINVKPDIKSYWTTDVMLETRTLVYSGRINGTAHGLANRVVKTCIARANVIGQGYHIYMDNYFTSPTLFTDLFQHYNTAACGTVRLNRRELPKDIMKKNPEGVTIRGDMQFRQKEAVAAVVWKDKKYVNLISSIHDFSVGGVQRNVQQADGIFQ
ncbi:unnamed protein product [Mytilus coruscus]|uniref:PiggyBac transposable element-derived protein domain-containing protein n=1 Tax=Mytilus coruscus TaxID=42192 RepID=A0A6J8DU12_MYTCO|nr:unnamed protein product [Mytilus coruscus]